MLITITSFQEIPLKFLESVPIHLQDESECSSPVVHKSHDIPKIEEKPLTSETNLSVEKSDISLGVGRGGGGSYGTLNDLAPDDIPKIVCFSIIYKVKYF